jgi:caffeoyl-CoA O-methyltransferase
MIVTEAVERYTRGLRPHPDPVLAEMERHAARDGVPIVVPQTGAFLHVLALACRAKRIVEVGTAIGVSTLYLARDLRLRDAREGLPELDERFDMAFIDGVKTQYGNYFERLLPLLREGGVLAVDNVLMGGTVAEDRSDGRWGEEQIASARAFNDRLLHREGLTGTVTPIGDGVLVAVKPSR